MTSPIRGLTVLTIGFTLAVSIVGAGQGPGLSLAVSVIRDTHSNAAYLRLNLEQAPHQPLPRHIRILSEDKGMELLGLSPGSRLAHIRVETSDGIRLDLEIRLLVRQGRSRWSVGIFSDGLGFTKVPVAKGELKNTSSAFELEIRAADWLMALSRDTAASYKATAEIDFDVPLLGPHRSDLTFSVSSFPR